MTAEPDLLPLPGLPNIGAGGQWSGWSDDDMRAYARANLAELQREVEGLRAERDSMTDAMNAALDQVIRFRAARHEAEARSERLAGALRELITAYVRLLESGRDRIRDLGGECDPVDVMERSDIDLRKARAALAQETTNG